MKSIVIFLICLVLCEYNVQSENKFPPYIKVCRRTENVIKCILNNIESCKPYLSKGIPRLLIPSMDPLNLPSLDIVGNGLKIKLSNLKVYNLPSAEIYDGYIDLDNFKFNLKLKIPYVYNEFQYEAQGKILSLQFNGDGTGYTNATDIILDIEAKGHSIQRDNKKYIILDYVNVIYKATSGKFHVENLFRNQKDLNDETNRLINENYDQFSDEVSPDIAKSIASVIKSIATNVFEKFSFDELFPRE